MVRRFALGLFAAGLAVLAGPAAASAHGLVGRTDLPIPSWLFGWSAAIVLIISFVALGSLWREPRLQHSPKRRLFAMPRAVVAACGLLGIGCFVFLVYCGFAGTSQPLQNLEPTFIYVHFWVGTVILSAVFGDVFRAFNPWRSFALAVSSTWRKLGGRPIRSREYPAWLGQWPAVAGVIGFAWLELAYADKDVPSTLAWLSIGYAAVQLAGMSAFGIETWTRRGDAFSCLFNLYSRISPLERHADGAVYLRRPLSGAPPLQIIPGTVVLLCAAIGTTTFDGLSNGPVWRSLGGDLAKLFRDLGFSTTVSVELASTVGLLFCVLLVGGVYATGVRGMVTVDHHHRQAELAHRFAHTLIPIAFAYAVAHYFSLLAYQGQAIGYLISDPLGNGANIFGTASATVNFKVISAAGIWYVQVAALVCGHVAGLTLAHDRALAVYSRVRDAARSQYWMLCVMVGFTSLGLWLLSAVNT
ncbi:MAG: fenitrothion hydrolase [Actinobacteria bacterium]|nr:fenitrothion hydrolase [Actinomycetota bacterium]